MHSQNALGAHGALAVVVGFSSLERLSTVNLAENQLEGGGYLVAELLASVSSLTVSLHRSFYLTSLHLQDFAPARCFYGSTDASNLAGAGPFG